MMLDGKEILCDRCGLEESEHDDPEWCEGFETHPLTLGEYMERTFEYGMAPAGAVLFVTGRARPLLVGHINRLGGVCDDCKEEDGEFERCVLPSDDGWREALMDAIRPEHDGEG